MREAVTSHALSVDVEDYFQVEAFADIVRPGDWGQFESRVVRNTHRVLELFADKGARATFFVLGWVAERYPQLVREIQSAGHEIGCHSKAHTPVWRLDPAAFRADTLRALEAIQNACGTRVRGYRAPTFSITRDTLWALDILAELGFDYDSSIFPVVHDRYGISDAPRTPFTWRSATGQSVLECPMSTVRVFGRNMPALGGGYLRILPLAYSRWALRCMEKEGTPAIIYFHPWEIDPDQPRINGRITSRLRHYHNLGKTEPRLRALLSERRFLPLQEVFADHLVNKEVVSFDDSVQRRLARAAVQQ